MYLVFVPNACISFLAVRINLPIFAKIFIRLLLLMGEKDKEIIIAPYLKAGDRVALVSPAYWVPEMVIMQAAEVLREWGAAARYRPSYHKSECGCLFGNSG